MTHNYPTSLWLFDMVNLQAQEGPDATFAETLTPSEASAAPTLGVLVSVKAQVHLSHQALGGQGRWAFKSPFQRATSH